jgi:hypothetical protein
MAGDNEGAKPEYEGKTTGELTEEYDSLHEIDIDKRINKPLKRERRLRRHRKSLTQIIDDTLGKDDEGNQHENFEHLSEAQAAEKSKSILTKLAHDFYKIDDGHAGKPNVNRVRQFLQLAGVNATYEDVIKEFRNMPDLRYDALPQNSNIRRIIDYVSRQKDTEGRKINLLQQYLTRPEHTEGLTKYVKGKTGIAFHPSATPIDKLDVHAQHVQQQMQKYVDTMDKTYTAKNHAA